MAPEAKSPFVHPVGGGKKVSLADLIVLAGCAGPGVAGAAGRARAGGFFFGGDSPNTGILPGKSEYR
jgi:catalase (peroxidase I)